MFIPLLHSTNPLLYFCDGGDGGGVGAVVESRNETASSSQKPARAPQHTHICISLYLYSSSSAAPMFRGQMRRKIQQIMRRRECVEQASGMEEEGMNK
jgi:hypothetical protein